MRVFAICLGVCLIAACAPVTDTTRRDPEPPPPPFEAPPRWDPWAALAAKVPPARDLIREPYRYVRDIDVVPGTPGFRYLSYQPSDLKSIVGFTLTNRGSSRVNPKGLQKTGAMRIYTFQFPDRARENIHVAINDDVDISGRFSHDNMYRELHFFPRLQLPAVERGDGGKTLTVTLPTGEPVLFDVRTKEIVGGVLREDPIDFHRDRYQRRNPGVHYQGDYMLITVAQRGEAPRRASVWGQTKYAEVHYPAKYAKPCRISPRHLWDQRPKRGDTDPTLIMLHATDAALFAAIEKQCHWDLTRLAMAASRGLGVPVSASRE